jgi:cytochrome c oxidase subunit III
VEPILPRHVSGSRSTLWWGALMLVAIEGTVMASLLASYFYLRVKAPSWPPVGIELPDLAVPTIANGLLAASVLPVIWGGRGIKRGRRGRLLAGLALGLLAITAYVLLSGYDLASSDYTWRTHAYGSLVWTIAGYSMLHALGLAAGALLLLVLAARGYFHERRHAGLEAVTAYWAFVSIAAVPVYGALYLSPFVG